MKNVVLIFAFALLCQGLFGSPFTAVGQDEAKATAKNLAKTLKAKKFEYPWKVDVYDLPESSNGVKYRLFVRHPLRPAPQGQKHSCFYFLDALSLFTPSAAMSYNYESFNYMPAAYFIGIGYQNEKNGPWREDNRTRDYTPTPFEPPNDKHFLWGKPVDYENSGGADAFFNVVEKEIIPFIEAKFKVDKEDRVLIGKSMSGLAAAYALLTRPGLFKRYLIISPAIWWDDFMKPRMDRAIMRAATETKGTKYPFETRAYFAVGVAEERMSLVTDLRVLVNSIERRYDPNLKVNIEVLPGEQHEGVYPAAFMRGIVGVYADDEKCRKTASPIRWNKSK